MGLGHYLSYPPCENTRMMITEILLLSTGFALFLTATTLAGMLCRIVRHQVEAESHVVCAVRTQARHDRPLTEN